LLYWDQGRWKEAEELDVQVMETSLKMLGAEHLDMLMLNTEYSDILASMANLISI
ncbi:hypothetical protein BGW36DRAFT_295419, partial [Talaromyces proteolyticus]